MCFQTQNDEEVEKMKVEIEQQKEVLNQWNTWGQAKTDEYNQLLEAYNQYVESYNKLTEEITDLKTANENLNEIFTSTQTSLQEKQNELLEKNAEIERLKLVENVEKVENQGVIGKFFFQKSNSLCSRNFQNVKLRPHFDEI